MSDLPDQLPLMQNRLSEIERTQERVIVLLEALTTKVDHRALQDAAWRGRVEMTIYGDGETSRGHAIRIDRLEQAAERQRWLIRALITGLVALGARALYELLAH